MKKILLSLFTIGVIAVAAVVATNAFFNDEETSTDNTFTSGSVDLLVDNKCTYLGLSCPEPTGIETSWTETDLGAIHKYFWFNDIKPGDFGEDTISLHVVDNDAWACLEVGVLDNDDNGITGSEGTAGDNTDGADNGELAQNLEFFAWLDEGAIDGFQGQGQDVTEGDNVWQSATELPLFSNVIGPASDVLNGITYPLADSNFSVLGATNPFVGSTTYYLGLAWCAGNLTNPGTGGNMTGNVGLNCDGTAMGNNTQTDSVKADLTFNVEQYRNNPSFTCRD